MPLFLLGVCKTRFLKWLMAFACEEALRKAGRIFRWLGRGVKACEPCCGVGGLRTWLEASGIDYTSECAYDFDNDIASFYRSLKADGSKGLDRVWCGPQLGDIEKVCEPMLPQCELLLSGPPSQPYAPNGKGGGFMDPRSEAFEVVLSWLVSLAWQGGLIAFVIENSTSLASHEFFWKLLNTLCCTIYSFLQDRGCGSRLEADVAPEQAKAVGARFEKGLPNRCGRPTPSASQVVRLQHPSLPPPAILGQLIAQC